MHPRSVTPLALTAVLSVLGTAACGGSVHPAPESSERADALGVFVPLPNTVLLDPATGRLSINGSGAADSATVTFGRSTILATLNGVVHDFPAADVKSIRFTGGSGNDVFTNRTALPSIAYGGPGDDKLIGGSGSDVLYGGDGNDALYGGAGADTLFGGPGDDVLFGGDGDDLLVTVGGGADTITGGPGLDNVWMDKFVDHLQDLSSEELLGGYLHEIEAFSSISYSGGNTWTPIPLEPLSQDLADPLPDFESANGTKDFSASPLFASAGPGRDDIFQGGIGDCYMLAALSAIADARPDAIRKLVAPLGDGTFAVRFYETDGAPVFYRVDADLWLDDAGGVLYARPGAEGSIWVPIVEKAYAFFRRDRGTYASIHGGDGLFPGQIGATMEQHPWSDGFTQEFVWQWHEDGKPMGTAQTQITASVVEMLTWISDRRAEGHPVVVGGAPSLGDGMVPTLVDDPNTEVIEKNNWRHGTHIFMADHVDWATFPNPTLFLRNPRGGPLVAVTDTAHIAFGLSSAGAYSLP